MVTFREIIQEIFYEKTRAVLTIMAIAWGTFAIAVMLAMGEGLRLNFAETMANAGNRLLMVLPGVTTKSYRGLGSNEPIQFTQRDLKVIASLPNVTGVSVQYNFGSRLRYLGRESYAEFRAVTSEYATIHNIQVGAKQRFLSWIDLKKRNSVVVLGTKTVEEFFPKEDPVGKTIYVNGRPFMVIGVMQPKPQLSSSGMPDRWLNWIPATTYELLHNPERIDEVAVAYRDFKKLMQTKAAIQKIIAFSHGADPSDVGIVNFSDLAEEQAKSQMFFIKMQVFLGMIGGLALFLAGVGVANVMYASVRRATQQIGVRMALGATTKQILFRYIAESLVATIIGGAIGIVLAFTFVYLYHFIPMPVLLIRIIGRPEPILSWLVLGIVVIVLGITGLLAGLFPALKAAKIDPAEALIYE